MSTKLKASYVFQFAAVVFIAANILQNSSLILYLGRDYVKYVYAVELLIMLGFLANGIRTKRIIVATAAIFYAGLVVLECVNFSEISDAKLNINSALPYIIVASICIFNDKYLSVRAVSRNIYAMSAVYAAIYVVIVLFFPDFYKPTASSASGNPLKIFGRDHYTDARLVLSTPYIAFGLTYALSAMREKFKITHLVGAVLFVLSILLSNYRYMMVALVPSIAVVYLYPLYKYIRWMVPVVFLIGTGVMISGAFDKRVNIYSVFSKDQSGLARVIEYDGAKDVISHHLFFGLGIPSSREDMEAIVKLAHPLFYDDIGPMGVLCGFGLIGLIGYLALGLAVSNFRISTTTKPASWEIALLGVGLFMTIYSFTAPTFWGEDGSVFAALILAYQLKSRFKLKPVPQALKGPGGLRPRQELYPVQGAAARAPKRRSRRLTGPFF